MHHPIHMKAAAMEVERSFCSLYEIDFSVLCQRNEHFMAMEPLFIQSDPQTAPTKDRPMKIIAATKNRDGIEVVLKPEMRPVAELHVVVHPPQPHDAAD